MKAVSAWLFSMAICCISSSGSHWGKGQMEAGFPLNGFDAKASAWYMGNEVICIF
jgi:hypothetical protein